MIYLYVKTHNKTGLKYLGKTTKDPFAYYGSGIYWCNHLSKHGKDISTDIIYQSESEEDIKEMGIHYSELWDVVESEEWANMKPEDGAGGSYWNKKNKHKHPAVVAAKNGTHQWQGENNPVYKRLEEGTHNFLGGKIQSKSNQERLKNGTHHLLDKSRNPTCVRSKNGTHHFTDPNSPSREKVRQNQKKAVENGTHSFCGTIQCVTPEGNLVRIPKEQYHSQEGSKDTWFYAHVSSKIGKSRKIIP